jgi:hypothetical protein
MLLFLLVACYFIGALFRLNALAHKRCKRCRSANLFFKALLWPVIWFYILTEGMGKSLYFFSYPHAARGLRCADCKQEIAFDPETEWSFID